MTKNCPFCDEEFKNEWGLSIHVSRKHGPTMPWWLFAVKDLDYVICKICGKKLKMITHQHLNIHNITSQEYKKMFPDAPVTCESCKLYGNNPMKDPNTVKRQIESRRKNDPDNLWTQRALETKRKRYPNNALAQKMVKTKRKIYGKSMGNENVGKTRRKNDPTHKWRQRAGETIKRTHPDIGKEIWKRRKENDPNDEWAQRAIETRRNNYPNNEWVPKMLDTRKQNDPENTYAKRAWITRVKYYGECGYMDYNDLVQRMRKIIKDKWDSLSPEERGVWLRKSVYKGNRRPNISESQVLVYIEPLGFIYNGNGPKRITGHYPDFIHNTYPFLIEYDGKGGHDPDIPQIPNNQPERDNQRDTDYQQKGYHILRLLPEDLKLGEEHIQDKAKTWMGKYLVQEVAT